MTGANEVVIGAKIKVEADKQSTEEAAKIISEALSAVVGPELAEKIVDELYKQTREKIPESSTNSNGTEEERAKEEGAKEEGGLNKNALVSASLQGINAASNLTTTLLKQSFGVIEDIHNQLKKSSPLLQTVESMFDLAMQLFFMPLGNKLAEVLIPSMVELVEKVVDMWDALDGMTLGEMFEFAIEYGVDLLSNFFNNIGNTLKDQGGLIGQVGTLILDISKFIQNTGVSLISLILESVGFIITHLKEMITLIVGFKALSTALQIAQIVATINSSLGPIGAITGVTAAAAVTAGTYAGLSSMGLADGGYVPKAPTDQGLLYPLGEKEGEYIVPESKLQSFVSAHSYRQGDSRAVSAQPIVMNNYITGYTDRELGTIITDKVNELNNRTRGR